MKIIGIIPSRLKSTRFPNKALVDIEGLPMIVHVFKRAQLCRSLDEVIVATDSKNIYDVVTSYNGKAMMTLAHHQTGTDRIAEVAEKIDCDIVINIQGDEPLLNPTDIEKLAETITNDASVDVATLVCRTPSFNNITECKIVLNLNNDILYMSRTDIPSLARGHADFLHKLYCIVAFRKPVLKKFASWPPTPLEKIEYIEYLRILEHGYKIRGIVVEEYSTSVDTPDDLKVIKEMMNKDKIKFRYLKDAKNRM